MMDVTQPHDEQQQADAAVGAAHVVPDRQFIDISPEINRHFDMGDPSLDATAFGSDGFRPYGSPSRVRMLHFRIEYRQKYVPIILQDINCVGKSAVVCDFVHDSIIRVVECNLFLNTFE